MYPNIPKGLILFLSTFWATSSSFSETLPTGEKIVNGSGVITTSGNTMNITQSSQKLVTHWQDFSIGKKNTVNFIQPSPSAIALNKVLGNNVSVIQGALNANGQVFLVNPNGVTFTPDARINVGGLVASTQNIDTQDFLASNYIFEGQSTNVIVNQGNITATQGGTVALIAAKIINQGTISSQSGNIMMGAGNKVTLDLGGPVKLEVEEGAITTLIEQGGAVHANGGMVYLTTKAVHELATSVINHTGITVAQTLSTGEKGEIVLLGDMDYGTTKVAGVIDASAPNGNDGGFIETSAANIKIANDTQISTKSQQGENGTWLIDPTDFTVSASGGDISGTALSSNLASGNVQIQTTGAGGNLYVNDEVSWSANKLTLTANNNIEINSNIIATGLGSLAFEYGLDSTSGLGSAYSIASGVDVLIPKAENFTWKKGSSGSVNNLYFGNSLIKFDENAGAAITDTGALRQPFYYDDGTSLSRTAGWYKLTYQNYPIDFGIATGGDGSNSWNYNGEVLATNGETSSLTLLDSVKNSLSINIANYDEGVGTLVATTNVNVNETANTIDIINSYTLEQDKKFVRTETTISNNSTTTPLTNVRLWIGTRDDFVGESDKNYMAKGNVSDGFVQIPDQDTQAKAIKITEEIDGTGAAVLFYSTSDGADTVTTGFGKFSKIMQKDPRSSEIITNKIDGSYALFLRMNDLSPNASENLIWYYAAGKASDIESIIQTVADDSNTITSPSLSSPSSPSVENSIPQTTAVSVVQSSAPLTNKIIITPLEINFSNDIGSLDMVQIDSSQVESDTTPLKNGKDKAIDYSTLFNGQSNVSGPLKVFVVDGGINFPSWVSSDFIRSFNQIKVDTQSQKR
ncbi:two-partner secretion domain-containing protein [Vibrio hepatarius]|uniref:two-partner secretion domain-containing protein n=1 Tax=Vibrio hepatarius TaxID=171383 RepID=UPI001C083941|nr:filamentous hemagglutinin N-terminal domain-containing protein [Vibrio hepatarius]MBU2896761.1 filamentous hemagglutinin N-terminal domain-containing protein [Vibrio hepatarius]